MEDHAHFGIIVSRFNWEIVEPLLNNTIKHLEEKGFDSEDMTIYEVPGALEIPAVARKTHVIHDALICLGAVVRGETSHYDIVCENTARALMDLSMALDAPIINGVLTVESVEQGLKRTERGAYFADAAIEMTILYGQIDDDVDQIVGDHDVYTMFEEN